jgi:hypothetical protein
MVWRFRGRTRGWGACWSVLEAAACHHLVAAPSAVWPLAGRMHQVRTCLLLTCVPSNLTPCMLPLRAGLLCFIRRSQTQWRAAAAKDDTSGEEEAELVQMDAARVLPNAWSCPWRGAGVAFPR